VRECDTDILFSSSVGRGLHVAECTFVQHDEYIDSIYTSAVMLLFTAITIATCFLLCLCLMQFFYTFEFVINYTIILVASLCFRYSHL